MNIINFKVMGIEPDSSELPVPLSHPHPPVYRLSYLLCSREVNGVAGSGVLR